MSEDQQHESFELASNHMFSDSENEKQNFENFGEDLLIPENNEEMNDVFENEEFKEEEPNENDIEIEMQNEFEKNDDDLFSGIENKHDFKKRKEDDIHNEQLNKKQKINNQTSISKANFSNNTEFELISNKNNGNQSKLKKDSIDKHQVSTKADIKSTKSKRNEFEEIENDVSLSNQQMSTTPTNSQENQYSKSQQTNKLSSQNKTPTTKRTSSPTQKHSFENSKKQKTKTNKKQEQEDSIGSMGFSTDDLEEILILSNESKNKRKERQRETKKEKELNEIQEKKINAITTSPKVSSQKLKQKQLQETEQEEIKRKMGLSVITADDLFDLEFPLPKNLKQQQQTQTQTPQKSNIQDLGENQIEENEEGNDDYNVHVTEEFEFKGNFLSEEEQQQEGEINELNEIHQINEEEEEEENENNIKEAKPKQRKFLELNQSDEEGDPEMFKPITFSNRSTSKSASDNENIKNYNTKTMNKKEKNEEEMNKNEHEAVDLTEEMDLEVLDQRSSISKQQKQTKITQTIIRTPNSLVGAVTSANGKLIIQTQQMKKQSPSKKLSVDRFVINSNNSNENESGKTASDTNTNTSTNNINNNDLSKHPMEKFKLVSKSEGPDVDAFVLDKETDPPIVVSCFLLCFVYIYFILFYLFSFFCRFLLTYINYYVPTKSKVSNFYIKLIKKIMEQY
jgi:hypothetical protein